MREIQNALYVVPTPIGNMDDITLRACEVLRNVDIICAEDTRHSLPLLERIGVKSPRLVSFHDHNESARAGEIAGLIEEGHSVALISDAGTPVVSDPGYRLVAACVEKNIAVFPLPGACAAITALSASGLPSDRFAFEGFLPVREAALREKLSSLKEEERTLIFYEAPRRILATAGILAEIFGDRKVMVARELTKAFETKYYATCAGLAGALRADPGFLKGEMVIVLAPPDKEKADGVPPEALKLLRLLAEELPARKAAAVAARMYGLRKNDLYARLIAEGGGRETDGPAGDGGG